MRNATKASRYGSYPGKSYLCCQPLDTPVISGIWPGASPGSESLVVCYDFPVWCCVCRYHREIKRLKDLQAMKETEMRSKQIMLDQARTHS